MKKPLIFFGEGLFLLWRSALLIKWLMLTKDPSCDSQGARRTTHYWFLRDPTLEGEACRSNAGIVSRCSYGQKTHPHLRYLKHASFSMQMNLKKEQHKGLACLACHTEPTEKKIETPDTCIGCHSPDDVHEGDFGPQCARCHFTSSWERLKRKARISR